MLASDPNFPQSVIDHLAERPRAALAFVDLFGHRRDYTYSEVAAHSQRYAAAMRALGVLQGETVVLCTANTARCLFIIFALERLGAIATLCGPAMKWQDVLARAQASGATTVVTNRFRVDDLDRIREALPSRTRFFLAGGEREGWARIDTLADAAKPFEGIAVAPYDPVFFFEDGILDRAQLSETIDTACEILDIDRDDRLWCSAAFGTREWLALAHAPFRSGAAAIVSEASFNADDRVDLVRELDATVLCAPANEYRDTLESPILRRARWLRLRRCIGIGADAELARRWEAETGKHLFCVPAGAFG